MNWNNRHFFMFCLLTALLPGCNNDEAEGPPPPDVSHIQADVKLKRFDQDLFKLDTLQPEAGLAALEAQYPEFSDIFMRFVLNIRTDKSERAAEAAFVKGFVSFPALRHLYDTIQLAYPQLDAYEKELEMAVRYFKYYFPDQPAPASVTTFISEYAYAAFIYGENDLAVGLDMFLGAGYPYGVYNPGNANFSDYLVRTYNQDHLVSKTLQPLVDDLLGETPGERLLDMMIHNGKKLYILDQLMPSAPDTVIMEVTPAQWNWLRDNELEMWGHFLKEELLYNTKWQDIRKLVEPSPNSPGMPPEAPGRTANWMGWQIVKAYMKRNPQTTLSELIALSDAQKLLDASKYKPRK